MTLEQIRKRKKQLGYTNAQLSNLTDIPLGTLNKILAGNTKNPRPENIQALEKVLNDTTYQYGYVSAAPFIISDGEVAYNTGNPRQKKPGEFTIEDYYDLPEDKRVELIDGVFYDMASPSVTHQLIAGSVYTQISNYIRGKKGKCLPFISPIDVKLDVDNKTMVQPDVLVVCNRDLVTERRIEGGPDFVMEVVSPSSILRDYVKKAGKYVGAGVREYWIVDPQKETVMVYHFPEDATPTLYPLSGKVPVGIFNNELEIDFDEFRF